MLSAYLPYFFFQMLGKDILSQCEYTMNTRKSQVQQLLNKGKA